MASTNALAPGTDTRTRASSTSRSAVAVVRCGATSVLPASRLVEARRADSTTASALSSDASSSRRRATTRSLGVASAGTSKPIDASTSTLRGVAMATWAARTPGASWTVRLTCSRVTESAYAPERSSTWVVMRRPLRGVASASSASRAPAISPAPEVLPTASRAVRARPRVAGAPRRRASRPSSGSTSPSSAQSSSVAESSVVRPSPARTAASTSGVGDPGRAVGRQPPAEHVVAQRGEPVAAAEQGRDGVDGQAGRGGRTRQARPPRPGGWPCR